MVAVFLHPKTFDMNLEPAPSILYRCLGTNLLSVQHVENSPHSMDSDHLSPGDDLELR